MKNLQTLFILLFLFSTSILFSQTEEEDWDVYIASYDQDQALQR